MKKASEDICGVIDIGYDKISSGTQINEEFDLNNSKSNIKQSMMLYPFIKTKSSEILLGNQRIQESPSLCLSQIESQLYNLFLTNNTQSIINIYKSCGVSDNIGLSGNKSEVNHYESDKNKYNGKVDVNMDVIPLERTKPIDFSSMKFIKCSCCSNRHIVRYNKHHKVEKLCIGCYEKKKLLKMKRENIKNRSTN